MHHGTRGEERIPGRKLETVHIEGRSRRDGACGAWAQHQPRSGADGGAHGAGADGRAGDEVRRQCALVSAQRPAGLAHKKGIELGLANRVVEHMGLVVENHLGPGDAAAEIDAGDHVERCRRITTRVDDIEGGKYIGDDFVVLVHRDRWRRAFLRPEPVEAAGIDNRHDLGREPFAQLALFSHGR